MQKNDVIEIVIDDMSLEGAGIGHYQGMTFFIKDAVTGDKISAIITKLKKTYGYAAIREILEPSTLRVEPKCAVSKRCGGCTLQAMSYDAQLEFKRNIVANNLKKIGGFNVCIDSNYDEKTAAVDLSEKALAVNVPEGGLADEHVYVNPCIGMSVPWNYRNKAQFPVGCDRDGNPIYGFYAARSHSIISADDCMLGIPENKIIMDKIMAWMKSEKVPAYDETSGKGLIRHVLIRKGFVTGEIMVCLVVNLGKNKIASEKNTEISEKSDGENLVINAHLVEVQGMKNLDFLLQDLASVSGMTSISISPNTSRENTIMGDCSITIWGSDVIRDKIGDITYEISPLSFYQVNPVQTEKLYGTALEYAGLTGNEVVWDLYCGIGTISLFLARNAKEVYGVEIIPDAIENAKKNAQINNITNANFMVGAAEDIVDSLPSADVIVVDPPRKGLDSKCVDTILKVQPEKIVYVSCDSATLARDLKLFAEGGYKISRVQPVDQFCHTCHVETCVLLSRGTYRRPDAKIKIDIDLDDYYRIKEGEVSK